VPCSPPVQCAQLLHCCHHWHLLHLHHLSPLSLCGTASLPTKTDHRCWLSSVLSGHWTCRWHASGVLSSCQCRSTELGESQLFCQNVMDHSRTLVVQWQKLCQKTDLLSILVVIQPAIHALQHCIDAKSLPEKSGGTARHWCACHT